MKKILCFFLLSFSLMASAEIQPGAIAPDFKLNDYQGKTQQLSSFKGSFVVLEWFNKDCPFVKKHYSSKNMQNLQKTFTAKKVIWLTINSSAPGKQGHENAQQAFATARALAASPTSVLLDSEGTVGKLYGAKTTPHMFIINPEQKVIYAGAIDDNPSYDVADIKTSRNFISEALDLSLAGKPVQVTSHRAYGCAVKY